MKKDTLKSTIVLFCFLVDVLNARISHRRYKHMKSLYVELNEIMFLIRDHSEFIANNLEPLFYSHLQVCVSEYGSLLKKYEEIAD